MPFKNPPTWAISSSTRKTASTIPAKSSLSRLAKTWSSAALWVVSRDNKIATYPVATDGSSRPQALGNVDATLIERDDALLLTRHAVVASSAVVWPPGITAPEKEVAIASLASLGILIRQSA